MSESSKIGVIGLGIIGKGIANHLRGTGAAEVCVWNRTPRPEPNFVGSLADLAHVSDIIQIFVTDGPALLSIMQQLQPHLSTRHIVLNHSTVDPQSSVQAYQIAEAAGADFLDAPFTGSRDAAAAGQLVYYIGGDAAVLERVRSALALSAREIIPVGGIGQASIIKIATNMISATTVQVLSEAYGLVGATGIDPSVLQTAIEHNACGSVLTSMKLPSIIEGDYQPHFSLKNMFKDANLALDIAKQSGVDLPALSTTANMMYRTMQRGDSAELDYSVLAQNYQAPASNS